MIIPRCLYRAALLLPFFHLNDVFLTGFCADLCRVPRIHNWLGVSPEGRPVETVSQLDVFIHYVGEEDKGRIWRILGKRRELTWGEQVKHWGWEVWEKMLSNT